MNPSSLSKQNSRQSVSSAHRPWHRSLMVVGLSLPLLAGALTTAKADQVLNLTPQQRSGLTLKTQSTQSSDRVPVTNGLAQIAPSDQASQVVMAPLAGQLVGTLPAPGMAVASGQVLVRISSGQLAELFGQWRRAVADALAARQALQRDKALYADGLISRKRLEATQASASVAEAHVSATRSQLIAAGVTDPEKRDAGDLRRAEIAVKAPIAGVVTQRSVMPGERVAQGAPLFKITSASQQVWLMSVSPDLLPPTGTALWLSVSGCPEPAKVGLVDLAVDPASQLVSLRAQPTQACAALRPGQYVDATLLQAAAESVVVVPQVAVTRIDGQDQVYVVRGGEIRAVSVQVLGRGNGQVYVQAKTEAALRAGDKVVTQGVSRLKAFELGMGGE